MLFENFYGKIILMGIFDKFKQKKQPVATISTAGSIMSGTQSTADRMNLANMVLDTILDGVIIIDANSSIRMINPAAATMIGYVTPEMAVGVNVTSVLKFENGEGVKIDDASNEVFGAIVRNEYFTTRKYVLVNVQNQRKPVAVTVAPVKNGHGEKVITLRDIKAELAHEGEQTEFISTASHEMRTPVATIDGYL
jgi:PAS domain S-box-containing protein